MLVVMAVKAQQFPIAAIRRVVVVVVIAMMDGELAQVGAREFPRTPTADPWIDLQRLLTIALGAPIGRVARFCNDAVRRRPGSLAAMPDATWRVRASSVR